MTTSVAKKTACGNFKKDQRGVSIKKHISTFKVSPAHYGRKDSEKSYLEPGIGREKMY